MLRKWFILSVVACFAGTSQSAKYYKSNDNKIHSSYLVHRNDDNTEAPIQKNSTTNNGDFESITPKFSSNTSKLSIEFSIDKNQGLVNVQYILYNKDIEPKIFNMMPKLLLNKETYFLLHGISEFNQNNYVDEFLDLGSSALLNFKSSNVVGVRWDVKKGVIVDPDIDIRAAVALGKRLGRAINSLRRKAGFSEPIYVIGHDLGAVAAAVLRNTVENPVDYIFGLDQRELKGDFQEYYLKQNAGLLVQTLTTNSTGYYYGHRNFFPQGGNMPYDDDKGNCFLCKSYRIFFDAINRDNSSYCHLATFCSNYQDYINDLCEHFPIVSYFNNIDANELPLGNYYVTETSSGC